MTTPAGRTVRLFLVDGVPSGIVTAEIMNWSGHALVAPRSEIGRVRRRPEGQKTGVYFLFGEVGNLAEQRPVYIGESDDVGKRIEQHATSQADEFFERFCIFTSKDSNLTKAHARYLESRLSKIATDSGRAKLLNSNVPPSGILPESDIADMEFFVSQIEIVLPVIGFEILKGRPVPISLDNDKPSPVAAASEPIKLRLVDGKSGVDAEALNSGSEYLVLKGSLARSRVQSSLEKHLSSYYSLRNTLIEDGSLKPKGDGSDLLVFSRDVAFTSPSAASAVILGRSDNGRNTWKIAGTSETLAQFQQRRIGIGAQ